ncbi:MAG: CRTAC1 family protein [Chloroflexota bacterium]
MHQTQNSQLAAETLYNRVHLWLIVFRGMLPPQSNTGYRQFVYQLLGLGVCIFCLLGCSQEISPIPPSPQTQEIPIQVTIQPLEIDTACAGRFIPHQLDHTTIASTKNVALYESNGSGVGINDLDNDGDLDIVLANLGDVNQILWNEGHLRFRSQPLTHGQSRAVTIVDVDGDGWQDIVFTRRLQKPTLWLNTRQGSENHFIQQDLPDVNHPFYTLDWVDLDNDGDLDFVAGSYDTELSKQQGAIFDYRGGGVGVFVYTRQNGTYLSQRLADEADALAIALPDLNQDGRPDILVGNDFGRPDYIWEQSETGWVETTPFSSMTENTMSFDVGDVNNDGSAEIFATDMKPYRQDKQTVETWQPLMEMMAHPPVDGDPQVVENVLQIRGADGQFINQAAGKIESATGWSWSSKFGDLNNDGFLDIYVVNGMIAEEMLPHLPNYELVERNQALRNDGLGNFVPAPEWGLGSTASGRGMSMADLDNDGDLDVVINNLMSPALLFENQLCQGASLTVDLRWRGNKNPFAIGAKLSLHSEDEAYHRAIGASSGYLSGDPSQVHFGVPQNTTLRKLIIQWTDGNVSTVETPTLNTNMRISRQD